MARSAAESGIDTVVCTPHLHEYEPETVESVRAVADELRGALAEAGVDLRLLVGFEADLGVATGGGVERLKQLTVEGTDTVLVLEMPYGGWPPYLEDTLFRLSTWGLKPVLAHPERNDQVQDRPEVLEGCLKAGAVAQCTVASLTGEFGRGPRRAFEAMLALGYVSLLATDAHAYRTDGWTLGPVLESLRGTLSEGELAALVDENPRRLLGGEPLLKIRPEPGGSARGGGSRSDGGRWLRSWRRGS